MRRFMMAAITLILIVSSGISLGAQDDPSKMPTTVLERMAGNWTWEGEQVDIDTDDSPYGQGGRFSGSSDDRLVLGGRFLLGQWQEKSPEGNILRGINLTGYDAKKQCYVRRSFMSDGSTDTGTFTLEGRIARSQSTITTGSGNKLLVKTVRTFSRDWTRQEGRQEISTDNGKTWKNWAEFVIEKSGDASHAMGIEGMWDLESISLDNSPIDMEGWRSLKTFQSGTFMCVGLERESGEVFRTHGGTYSFDGRTLTETITFVGGENTQIKVGQSFTYDIGIKDGKIHQSGQFNEQQLDEIWHRVTD